jgi:5'-3' exonuclease
MILEVLEAYGIATAGAEGFEADDVLGTLATVECQDQVVVVSGDRDLLQLVGDDPVEIRVLYIGQGLKKATLFGPAEVAERYGVPAERAGDAYAELALLRGDPSDGLPGVPGIGEKTASTMLTQYGSLENILSAADDPTSALPKAFRAKILAATDYIAAAKPVVRVARDAQVQLFTSDDSLPLHAANPARVAELAVRNGLGSSIGRLQKALDSLSA